MTAIFGKQAIGIQTDQAPGGPWLISRGQRDLCGANGIVYTVKAYIQSFSGNLGKVKVAIYADAGNGHPEGLLATSDEQDNPVAFAWVTFNFTGLAVTNGAYYWLVFLCNVEGIKVRFDDTLDTYYTAAVVYPNFPNPFPAYNTDLGTGDVTIYAEVTEGGLQMTVLGGMTLQKGNPIEP